MQRKIGLAWTERGRPPAGYVTKRLAEAWLRDVLDQARRGTLPGMVRTGATFADAAEFLRYAAADRDCKPSTMRDSRSIVATHLVPRFGEQRIEDVTPQMIEEWRTLDLVIAHRPAKRAYREPARMTRCGPVPHGDASTIHSRPDFRNRRL